MVPFSRSDPLRRRHDLLARSALCGVLAGALGVLATPRAYGLPVQAPSPPQVAGGAAGQPVITSSGSTTTVATNASRTLIDWQSYTVGSGEAVNYSFDTRSDIVLNRLTNSSPVVVDGAINATVGGAVGGNVWFSAPGGVIFGSGAVVDVGGLLATTALVDPNAFLNNASSFPFAYPGTGYPGTTSYPGITAYPTTGVAGGVGGVTVAGTDGAGPGAQITTNGGLLALIAPFVNIGPGAAVRSAAFTQPGLPAAAGSVLYGAANAFTVSLTQESSGDLDMLQFVISDPSQVTDTPLLLAGSTQGTNVFAASLTASGIAGAVVDARGDIAATQASAGEGGEIILSSNADTITAPTYAGSTYAPGSATNSGALAFNGADIEVADLSSSRDLQIASSGAIAGSNGGFNTLGVGTDATLTAQGAIALDAATTGGSLSATALNGDNQGLGPVSVGTASAGGDILLKGANVTATSLTAGASGLGSIDAEAYDASGGGGNAFVDIGAAAATGQITVYATDGYASVTSLTFNGTDQVLNLDAFGAQPVYLGYRQGGQGGDTGGVGSVGGPGASSAAIYLSANGDIDVDVAGDVTIASAVASNIYVTASGLADVVYANTAGGAVDPIDVTGATAMLGAGVSQDAINVTATNGAATVGDVTAAGDVSLSAANGPVTLHSATLASGTGYAGGSSALNVSTRGSPADVTLGVAGDSGSFVTGATAITVQSAGAVTANVPLTAGGAIAISGAGAIQTGDLSAQGVVDLSGASVSAGAVSAGTAGVSIVASGLSNGGVATPGSGPVSLTSIAVGGPLLIQSHGEIALASTIQSSSAQVYNDDTGGSGANFGGSVTVTAGDFTYNGVTDSGNVTATTIMGAGGVTVAAGAGGDIRLQQAVAGGGDLGLEGRVLSLGDISAQGEVAISAGSVSAGAVSAGTGGVQALILGVGANGMITPGSGTFSITSLNTPGALVAYSDGTVSVASAIHAASIQIYNNDTGVSGASFGGAVTTDTGDFIYENANGATGDVTGTTITSAGGISIYTGGRINLDRATANGGNLSLSGGGALSLGDVSAQGEIGLSGGGVSVRTVSAGNAGASIFSEGPVSVTSISTPGALFVGSSGQISITSTLQAGSALFFNDDTTTGGASFGGAVSTTAGDFRYDQLAGATGDVTGTTITSAGGVTINTGGGVSVGQAIANGGDLTLDGAGPLSLSKGQASGSARLTGSSLTLGGLAGALAGDIDIDVTDAGFAYAPTLAAGGSVNVSAAQALTLGAVTAGAGSITLSGASVATGDLAAVAGLYAAGLDGDVDLGSATAGGHIGLAARGSITAGDLTSGSLASGAGAVDLRAGLENAQNPSPNPSGAIDAGKLTAGDYINIVSAPAGVTLASATTGPNYQTQGWVHVLGYLTGPVEAPYSQTYEASDPAFIATGPVRAGSDATLLAAGPLLVEGAVGAGGYINLQGGGVSAGDLTAGSADPYGHGVFVNATGAAAALGDATAAGGGVLLTGGSVDAGALQAAGAISVSATNGFADVGSAASTGGGNISITSAAGYASLGSASFASGGVLTLAASGPSGVVYLGYAPGGQGLGGGGGGVSGASAVEVTAAGAADVDLSGAAVLDQVTTGGAASLTADSVSVNGVAAGQGVSVLARSGDAALGSVTALGPINISGDVVDATKILNQDEDYNDPQGGAVTVASKLGNVNVSDVESYVGAINISSNHDLNIGAVIGNGVNVSAEGAADVGLASTITSVFGPGGDFVGYHASDLPIGVSGSQVVLNQGYGYGPFSIVATDGGADIGDLEFGGGAVSISAMNGTASLHSAAPFGTDIDFPPLPTVGLTQPSPSAVSISATGVGADADVGGASQTGQLPGLGYVVGESALIVGADRDVTVNVGQPITLTSAQAGGSLALTAPSLSLDALSGSLSGDVAIDATGGDLVSTADLTAGGSVTATAAGALSLAGATAGGSVSLAGQTVTLGPARAGTDLTLEAAGALTADALTAGRALSVQSGGLATLGTATAASTATILAGDVDLSGGLAAPTVIIQSAGGPLQLGGATAPTSPALWLSAAEFARIQASAALELYAGPVGGTARGAFTVMDLAVDPARTPVVDLYAGPSQTVDVLGAAAPTASGGTFAVGGVAGFTPGTILISGGLGAATYVSDTQFTGVRAFQEVDLRSGGDILMGSPRFIALVQPDGPGQIDIVRDRPGGVAAEGGEIGRVFVAAGRLDLTAAGKVVQQNTSGGPTAYAGLYLTSPSDPGVALSIDPPTLVDLFGSYVGANGELQSGPQAAHGSGLAVAGLGQGGAGSPPSSYRFNGCSLSLSIGCGAVVGPEQGVQPDQDFQADSPAAAAAAEADATVRPDQLTASVLLTVAPLLQAEDQTDPVITGAGNEEIWRKRPGDPR